jgi:hypothetical protein
LLNSFMLIKGWHLNKKLKNDSADTSWKEDLLIDIIFGPCYFSWDTPFFNGTAQSERVTKQYIF